MDELFAQFEEILNQELELYRKILELSKKKTDVILTGDTAGLDDITKAEHAFIIQAGALERKRQKFITEKLMKCDGISSCETLSELIQYAPASHKQRLASIGKELSELLEEQKEINELNSKLIRNNLEYIEFILSRVQGSAGVYDTGGTKKKDNARSSVLDKKV